MIKFKKSTRPDYCLCCHGKKDIYTVEMSNKWQAGVGIHLCLVCLEELVSLGQMIVQGEGKVDFVSMEELEG